MRSREELLFTPEDGMTLFDEISSVRQRFEDRITELQTLLREFQVRSVPKLIQTYRSDELFRQRWQHIWTSAARDDGGKLSLATAGIIYGAALGGVGIAAAGGAIGLPIAAVLGLLGLVAGSEFDQAIKKRWGGTRSVHLPRDLYDQLTAKASELGVRSETLLVSFVELGLEL